MKNKVYSSIDFNKGKEVIRLTEKQLREYVVNEFLKWEGYNKTNGGHTKIVNLYNSLSPLPSG